MSDNKRSMELNERACSRGMHLVRSRRINPDAIDYNGYMLVDTKTNTVVIGATGYAYSADLDEVETYLAD